MRCQHFHGRKRLNSDFRHNFLVRCSRPDYRPIPRYKVSRWPNHDRSARYAFALAQIRRFAYYNLGGNLVGCARRSRIVQIVGNTQFAKLELPGCCLTGNIPNIICASKLSIKSKEWAVFGVPLDMVIMVGFFIFLLLT
jgi:hypothetical protein